MRFSRAPLVRSWKKSPLIEKILIVLSEAVNRFHHWLFLAPVKIFGVSARHEIRANSRLASFVTHYRFQFVVAMIDQVREWYIASPPSFDRKKRDSAVIMRERRMYVFLLSF